MRGQTAGRLADRPERCNYCQATAIVRRGRRKKKFELVQLWRCRACGRTFTAQRVPGKTYPMRLILQALMLFYQGETREKTVELIRQRFGIAVPVRTLASWLAEYRELTTYAAMRQQGRAAFRPDRLIRRVALAHREVRRYRVHQGKLAALLAEPAQRRLAPIADYLNAMLTDCPYVLFSSDAPEIADAYTFDPDRLAIRTDDRHNACQLADLVLSATAARRPHDEVLQFVLSTDSATVAVAVPIYLTADEVERFRASGFDIPIELPQTLAGHIDALQVCDGRIHILVYQPRAAKGKPIARLLSYALALSIRTGLDMSDFVCAWFDEQACHTFDPVQAARQAH